MRKQVHSRVCSCGKGYRSQVDLLCRNCRSKDEQKAFDASMHRLIYSPNKQTQMVMFGFYTPDTQPHDKIEVLVIG